MNDRFTLKIQGLRKMVDRMDFRAPLSNTLGKFIRASGETIAGEARAATPVDNGTLRASIVSNYTEEPGFYSAVIGSNVSYAPYMEFGTGTQHDHPNWPRKPHKVAPEALVAWATRKLRGTGKDGQPLTPEALARRAAFAIMARGGLKPRRMLRNAFNRLGPYVIEGLGRITRGIINGRTG